MGLKSTANTSSIRILYPDGSISSSGSPAWQPQAEGTSGVTKSIFARTLTQFHSNKPTEHILLRAILHVQSLILWRTQSLKRWVSSSRARHTLRSPSDKEADQASSPCAAPTAAGWPARRSQPRRRPGRPEVSYRSVTLMDLKETNQWLSCRQAECR